MMKIPSSFYYSGNHVAVKKMKEGRVRLYLTEYVLSLSDEIEDITLNIEPGMEIFQGDIIGEVIMPDYNFEIVSPVSGIVRKVNQEISPDILFSEDGIYKEGWIAEVETEDDIESELMSAKEYKEFLEEIEEQEQL